MMKFLATLSIPFSMVASCAGNDNPPPAPAPTTTTAPAEYSTIGATPVPTDLHCEEDEMIGFNPDTPYNGLECTHPDVFVTRYNEQQVND